MDKAKTNFLDTIVNRAKTLWANTSSNQRILMLAVAGVMTIAFVMFVLWINKPIYKTLYSDLAQEDANKVVTYLEENNVPYELINEGSTITVPEEQVYDLRLKVAGQGNLVGAGVGFEIFDEVQVGQTEFVQKINYQRALQGELGRTLSELPNVESARVHLVIPERSLFIEEQQSPSASIVLKLENNAVKMSPSEVQGIVNLMTMSIQGLDKHHVSITDSAGNSIYTPEEEGFSANNTQLEYRMRFEKILERRINELLSPILGAGKSIAKVSAELDYSQRTYRKETFDPDSQVVRSEQRSEETQTGQANLEAGSPDANFRGDGLNNSLSSQSGQREQRTTNYEINKIEENIIGQMGSVNRLTIAVAIDGTYVQNEDGNMTYVPRSEEELSRIRQLVANAVGLDSMRGDTIEVSNIAFDETSSNMEANTTELLVDFANRMIKTILTALLVFFFIMFVLRPIIMSIIRPRVESGEILEGLEGLPAAEEQYALFEEQEQEARKAATAAQMSQQMLAEASLYSIEETLSLDDIKAKALQLAERNMELTISIVREWINEPTKSKAA